MKVLDLRQDKTIEACIKFYYKTYEISLTNYNGANNTTVFRDAESAAVLFLAEGTGAEEVAAAMAWIDMETSKPKNFKVGAKYNWSVKEAPHHQGRRHEPLVCVYVGQHQGLFEDQISEAGVFENAAGLHIIATRHLRSGDIVEVK